MKPGEIMTAEGTITLNEGRETGEIEVANTGRSARTITFSKPTRGCRSTGRRCAVSGLISRRERPSGSNRDRPDPFGWSHMTVSVSSAGLTRR